MYRKKPLNTYHFLILVDRDSYILIWELLILLLRQKSAIDGCDIAELLLKDRKDFYKPYTVNHNYDHLSNRNFDKESCSTADADDLSGSSVAEGEVNGEDKELGTKIKQERYIHSFIFLVIYDRTIN